MEGFPGEWVPVRVQMRTDVPLNEIAFWLTWPVGDVECPDDSFDARPLLENPDTGEPYPVDPSHHLPKCVKLTTG